MSSPQLEHAHAHGAAHVSHAGLQFLMREEGFVPHAYNDSRGNATFGVGHLIHIGRVTAADRRRFGSKAHPKSRAFVKRVLRQDIERFERAVLDAVTVRLAPHELDALVSLAFNIGTGAFATSTVVRRLNAGDRRGAADAFLLFRIPPELIHRRRRERALFLG
jgi:GH24 family phage-related lysozyme (muramidase)